MVDLAVEGRQVVGAELVEVAVSTRPGEHLHQLDRRGEVPVEAPGGGEGRTVYVDFEARKLADYEGVVRPGCFDGVVPANGRLYWMPLACDCWQVHGTFCMAPRSPLTQPTETTEPPAWAAPVCDAPAARGRRRCGVGSRGGLPRRCAAP